MPIIYLSASLRQVLDGQDGSPPSCPTDPHHALVRNGTYARQVQGRIGWSTLVVQRYLCRTCAVTYSALPYDCRPYTAYSWAIVLAAGWIWPRERHWTWARCHAWLRQHQIDAHQRTVERWAARWRAGEAALIRTALRWIAKQLGTRSLPVWPLPPDTRLHHWRLLWKMVTHHRPPARIGGWIANSCLWEWIPITFFAGMA